MKTDTLELPPAAEGTYSMRQRACTGSASLRTPPRIAASTVKPSRKHSAKDAATLGKPSHEPATHKHSSPIRRYLHSLLLPVVQAEAAYIHTLQKHIKSPAVDAIFSYIGALGTHTAFLLLLPMLFWFESNHIIDVYGKPVDVNRVFARSLVLLLAAGVYFSGAAKDYLGLPRPISPPVIRISISPSIELEYGFPSTHTTNAVTLSLFTALFFLRYWAASVSDSAAHLILVALVIYPILIGISRIATGMHGPIDVLSGALLGAGIVGVHWFWVMPAMEEWLMTSWTVPITAIPLCIILISIHPDPDGPCPCFDDSVSFTGVVMGLLLGNWHYSLITDNSPHHLREVRDWGLWMVLQRLVIGVSIIVGWRLLAKRICYRALPPLYRVLALPFGRKYFALADKDYKNIPPSHVGSMAPSLLHLPGKRYKLPRYDVDIATKLIVYSGIAWLASEGIPVVFEQLKF
ncbi:phosphatidic acid phosphatase type 2/haloperoxidase [Gaertneriomyces semiglobifer]|nr:phosphatidic acid phosphatase type 2/haloperoxidase [Gaertneriomyces semiglobifer]